MKRLGLISVFLLCSLWLGAQTQWRLAKEKDGIKVFLPVKNNGTLQEFKVTGTIDKTPAQILAKLKDAKTYPLWIAQISDAKVIKSYNANRFVVWYKIAMPTGFRDRDVVVENSIEYLDGGKIKVNLSSKPLDYPKQDGMLRIVVAHGYWLLIPQGSKTKVTYEFHYDPQINLPTWLVNKFMVEKPYQTLVNLNKQ